MELGTGIQGWSSFHHHSLLQKDHPQKGLDSRFGKGVLVPSIMRNRVTHSETSRYFIQSFANGLKVLECFGEDREGLTLMDLARKLGWTKTSAFRYLATLTTLGYLEIDEPRRRYRPTVKVLNLGYSALNSLTFPELALPFLERLSREFDESTNMAVLDGTEVVYVARAGSKRILATNLNVGSRLPAYCTSMGKVLLAFLPEKEQELRLKRIVFRSYTPKTVTNPSTLRRVLAQVRRQKYAINDQELDLGLRSCSVPVFDRDSNVVAAINLSMSSLRASVDEVAQKFVPTLTAASGEITAILRARQ
jgi:IclR family transcriptional regulator, pca regulon regulatory protein